MPWNPQQHNPKPQDTFHNPKPRDTSHSTIPWRQILFTNVSKVTLLKKIFWSFILVFHFLLLLKDFYNNSPNLPSLSRVCPFLSQMLHPGRLWQGGWGGGQRMEAPQDSWAWAGGRVSRTLRLSWDPTAVEEPLQRTAEGVPLPFCWGGSSQPLPLLCSSRGHPLGLGPPSSTLAAVTLPSLCPWQYPAIVLAATGH